MVFYFLFYYFKKILKSSEFEMIVDTTANRYTSSKVTGFSSAYLGLTRILEIASLPRSLV